MAKPLDGIRVLDFSHALAGPYCTMLMAAYGAQVYKIEGTEAIDMGRTWGPPFQGGEASYFLGINSGKQSVSIDIKHPKGLELCLRMVEKADVLIENFRPGAMTRLGLGYEAARARNPRLVYCSISGYGQNGPRRDDAAMDLILQASSGLISVTGTPDGHVARCGHSVADITAGMFSLIGILMALRVREQTGRGQFVDVAMLDAMISAMGSNYANLLGSGVVPKPLGTAFATIVPYAAFPAKDREIAIAVASEKLWGTFCQAIGKPEWTNDPRFRTNPLRVANRGELEPMIVEVFRTRTAAEWTEHFKKTGIPCTPVRTLDEVAADPQAEAREMFPVVEHPRAGAVKVTGAPVKFSETPGKIESAAPLLGQHTRQALSGLLDLTTAEVDALAGEGVLKLGS
ncbi:MAG: CoA transferase [Bryobacteraceae bacterium]